MTTARKHVLVYTDGSCLGNPGLGGYGAVLLYGDHRRELAGGYRWTTINRMELLAAICALEALTQPCVATVCTDSEYVVKNAERLPEWRARGWTTGDGAPVANRDLWERLTAAREPHHVTLCWVRAHAGSPENERADAIAKAAAYGADLAIDIGYEDAQRDKQRARRDRAAGKRGIFRQRTYF